MPAPRLLQLCTATAIRNVKYLNDIGNLPYSLARPFLLKIESPEKLRTIEQQSPHIIQEDGELWMEFIKRDIPKWEEYELPDNPDAWSDVYYELRERVQRAVEEDAEKMMMAMNGIKSERAKNSAKFVTDRRDIPLPRLRPTTKQRYASFDRKVGGIKPVFASPSRSTGGPGFDPLSAPKWSFERPQLPREPKKKNNIFAATKRNPVLAVPTKQLNNRASQVRQAPRSLVEEHRRPPPPPPTSRPRKDPPPGVPSMRAPGRSRMQCVSEPRIQSPVVTPSLAEREARLRAITSGQGSGTHPSSASPARSFAAANPGMRPAAISPAREPGLPLHAASQSKARPQASASDNSRPAATPEFGSSAAQSPPRVINIRKRPASSVFIQQKKKRLT